MFFALSILFVLITLYFLVYDGKHTIVNQVSFEGDGIIEKTTDINPQIPLLIDFDALVMPDEPSIVILKEENDSAQKA